MKSTVNPRKKFGTCALTDNDGPFVKSHLLPRAFMKRYDHSPAKEFGDPKLPGKKRFDGWYDLELCTAEGESVLAKHDDYAAKTFLGEGMLYRQRRKEEDPSQMIGGFEPNSIRFVDRVNPERLANFGRSLLWRFAISNQDVAETVKMPRKHLDHLAAIIRGEVSTSPTRYPVYFAVASDGPELMKMGPHRVGKYPFVRFFLDGVVCYASPFSKHPKFSDLQFMFAGMKQTSLPIWCFDSRNSDHFEYQARMARSIFLAQGDPF